MAWSPTLFFDTTPCQSATYASYPNVRTRALGTLDGSRDCGHGAMESFAVHVFSRSPVRPWTNIILVREHLVSNGASFQDIKEVQIL